MSPDGQSLTLIADCTHPIYKGCRGNPSNSYYTLTSYPGVDPDANFYFSLKERNGDFLPTRLYRVRAGSSEPELVPGLSKNRGPTNGFGYILGPDGTLWTVFSNIDGSYPSSLEPGETEWKDTLNLYHDNMHVYVSNQGRVFLLETGYTFGEGIDELVKE